MRTPLEKSIQQLPLASKPGILGVVPDHERLATHGAQFVLSELFENREGAGDGISVTIRRRRSQRA
jgi:hypothetical protein